MTQYRKKPVVIEAAQFNAADPKSDTFGVVNFSEPSADGRSQSSLDNKHWVRTLEGPLVVSDGDWIIKGIKGEFYPCKPDIFAATYDLVSAPLRGEG